MKGLQRASTEGAPPNVVPIDSWSGTLKLTGKHYGQTKVKKWAVREMVSLDQLRASIAQEAKIVYDETAPYDIRYEDTSYNKVYIIMPEDNLPGILNHYQGVIDLVDPIKEDYEIEEARRRAKPQAVFSNIKPTKIYVNQGWTSDPANVLSMQIREKREALVDEVIDEYRTHGTIPWVSGDQFIRRYNPKEKKFSCWYYAVCLARVFCPCCCIKPFQGVPVVMYIHGGQYEHVQKAIMQGCDVNARDKNGVSCLSLAVMQERSDIVTLIIESGNDYRSVDLNIKDKRSGLTPLHHAAAQNNPDATRIAEKLLTAGCDINPVDNGGKTPFMLAAQNANFEVATLLNCEATRADMQLCSGRSGYVEIVDCRDNAGWTPLHFAAAANQVEMCEFLLDECDANQHKLDKNKMTASVVAAKMGHGEVQAYLDHKNPHIFDPYDANRVDARF